VGTLLSYSLPFLLSSKKN